MKTFYVASSFRNIESVQYIAGKLKSNGYVHTYDWTKHANRRDLQPFTVRELEEIGKVEKKGVLDADVVVVLLPGGKGTHIELGIALGHEKRIILHSPNDEVKNLEATSTFYHLAEVEKCFGTLDEVVEQIIREEDCSTEGSR